jgi:hypothetical protein
MVWMKKQLRNRKIYNSHHFKTPTRGQTFKPVNEWDTYLRLTDFILKLTAIRNEQTLTECKKGKSTILRCHLLIKKNLEEFGCNCF